jgi:peptidoglycan/LPS O-acetylase OafA/YrhL
MGTWRLILAWMVVAVHTQGYQNLFSINIGTIAVSTFFFISGFLMPLTYQTHYQQNDFLNGSVRFYLNRILKIYPIYWASLLIALGFYLISYVLHHDVRDTRLELIGPLTYIQNFLLIGLNQSSFWGGYDRFNNPAWTLDVELQYYLLVPFLVFLASKYKTFLKWIFISFSAISLYLYFKPAELVDIDRSILSWSVFFIIGFVFYEAIVFKSLSNSVYLFILVIAGLLYAANKDRETVTLLITILFIMISAFLLIMQKDYRFGSIDQFAGDLSYPTYILHIIFFGPTIKLIGFTPLANLKLLPQFSITCLIHIVVSTLVGYIALKFISDPVDLVRVRIKRLKDKDISKMVVLKQHL